MASQSASQGQNDPEFQQNAAAKFSSLQQNSQGVDGLLAQLAADKGLANYDKNDELETCLKEFVNANKDALSAVNTLIQNDPALGPILGPSRLSVPVALSLSHAQFLQSYTRSNVSSTIFWISRKI